jgi:hypothetical protein
VTLAVPETGALQALLLARSIRDFGGTVAGEPIWALVPNRGQRMSRALAVEFEDLGVRLVPFSTHDHLAEIPFGVKASAGAHAETRVETDLLIWLDPDTLIVGGAGEFLLPESAALGYRPVHHRLIGIDADEPIDGFWAAVLEACGVPEERLFRMYTSVGERIKAYLNAGVFVVRPERRLLQSWEATFGRLARDAGIIAHLRSDPRYSTFLHQVVWTAVVLRNLERTETAELSNAINYPLHLHWSIPAGRRAISLQRLTAIRTEDLLLDPEWREEAPLLGSLVPWLEQQPLLGGG